MHPGSPKQSLHVKTSSTVSSQIDAVRTYEAKIKSKQALRATTTKLARSPATQRIDQGSQSVLVSVG